MRNVIRCVCAVAAAGALFGLSTHAFSADTRKLSIKVLAYDLDISQRADAEALYARISRAARVVCRQPGELYSARLAGAAAQCRAQAVNDAVLGADRPQLAAVHRSAVDERTRFARRDRDEE